MAGIHEQIGSGSVVKSHAQEVTKTPAIFRRSAFASTAMAIASPAKLDRRKACTICEHEGRARDRCEHTWWGSFRGARVSLPSGGTTEIPTKADAGAV